MTPAEIIDNVLGDLERPDLEPQAIAKFLAALKSAHQTGFWKRDLVIFDVAEVDFTPVAGVFSVTLPAGIRKLLSIRTYDGTPGNLVDSKFVDLQDRVEDQNYFGFVNPQTYNLFGDTLNVSGISTNAARMELRYVAWPTFALDVDTQEYVTNSWIAVEFPQLIEAALKVQLARITQQEDVIATSANTFTVYRSEFLSTYYEEMLNELRS